METLAQLHANGNKEDACIHVQIVDENEMLPNHTLRCSKIDRISEGSSSHGNSSQYQMTGVSVIQYFSPAIFAHLGISANKTLPCQGINSVLGELA